MNFKGVVAYLSKKENIPYNIFYLVGFIVACYSYGIHVAMLLLLFTLSVLIAGFFISDFFFFIKNKKGDFDIYKISSTLLFVICITLDILFLDLLFISYVVFLGLLIAVLGIYLPKFKK